MACFIVPAAEAVVTTIVQRAVKKQETQVQMQTAEVPSEDKQEMTGRIPLSEKLKWLNTMLWGGSALLAFEHVWHGEVTPWFPFLTAAANPADTSEMLHEMATSGVAMAVLVTAVWGVMAAVTGMIVRRAAGKQTVQTQEEA